MMTRDANAINNLLSKGREMESMTLNQWVNDKRNSMIKELKELGLPIEHALVEPMDDVVDMTDFEQRVSDAFMALSKAKGRGA